jgi:FkbM family methyltransferase
MSSQTTIPQSRLDGGPRNSTNTAPSSAGLISQNAGIIVKAFLRGKEVYFFVSNIWDAIQNHHLNGAFYELEELQIIARYFKRNGVFLDIGSNVGNHAIYVEKFLDPASIIVIEPNPAAINILDLNIRLNQLSRIDSQFIGVGLGDREETVAIDVPVNNLGGARLRPQQAARLHVVRGDSLFRGRSIDFIKIDVEGAELKVLRGLEETLTANRPRIFIEVENEHANAFVDWAKQHHYRIVERFRRWPPNENFMIVPEEH